jgi:hypothetical protein
MMRFRKEGPALSSEMPRPLIGPRLTKIVDLVEEGKIDSKKVMVVVVAMVVVVVVGGW